MNVFDRDSESLTSDSLVAVWVAFKCAISDLLENYNAGPRGDDRPAEVYEDTERTLVIRCRKGTVTNEMYSQKMVSVRLSRKDREYAIHCVIQRWIQRAGGTIQPHVESEQKLSLLLGSDGKSLKLKAEKLTPYETAERILEMAFLRD